MTVAQSQLPSDMLATINKYSKAKEKRRQNMATLTSRIPIHSTVRKCVLQFLIRLTLLIDSVCLR